MKEHNSNWPKIPVSLHRNVIVGCSEYGKTIAFFNLIDHEPDIEKILLYAKYHIKQNINSKLTKDKVQA